LVSDKELDRLEGIVHIKDLFVEDLNPEDFHLKNHIKKALYVHENSAAYKVLEEFKKSRVQLAVVLDEYGSIEGVISINDILDALVGDYNTDGDEEDLKITQRNETSWLADGQFPFHE